jgi:hypothetical protein
MYSSVLISVGTIFEIDAKCFGRVHRGDYTDLFMRVVTVRKFAGPSHRLQRLYRRCH